MKEILKELRGNKYNSKDGKEPLVETALEGVGFGSNLAVIRNNKLAEYLAKSTAFNPLSSVSNMIGAGGGDEGTDAPGENGNGELPHFQEWARSFSVCMREVCARSVLFLVPMWLFIGSRVVSAL
jgi:hypothetical protein